MFLEETYRIRVERGDTNFLTRELLKDKPIVFLTQDDPRDAPVDTRQYEFIRYDLGKHEDFLPKLDNAVRNVLGSSLDIPRFYRLACELLAQFDLENGVTHRQISRDEFHSRIVRDAQMNEVLSFDDATLLGNFLLPRIMKEADADVMGRVTAWLKHRGTATG